MSRRARLYYGGKRPDGDPPIPPIFTPPQRSKEMLLLDAEYARKRIDAERARLEAESTRLDLQEQQLMELEQEIEELDD